MPNVWPVGLPTKPLAGTYEEPQDENLHKSPVGAGNPRQRRIGTKAVQYVSGTWLLDESVELSPGLSQVDAFKLFFNDACKSGQEPFEMPHPRTEVTTEFYFDNTPSPRHKVGKQYEVALKLRIK